ncbi:MAG: response regulator [Candidatus Anammoxibacter sp.]
MTENRPNILVVDDKEPNLLAMKKLLEDFDANIITGTNGNEALQHIIKTEFAIILMDVQMPVMDGFEAASIIRAENNQTPIIFLTAVSISDEMVLKGYEMGAVDYLIKPFEAEILKCKVKIFLRLYNQEKQLEKMVGDLQRSLAENKILEGLLPICASCKKIRDDKGYWNQVEEYIRARTDVEFTHSICPECAKTLYPELNLDKK